MSLTAQEFWTVIHGMILGTLFLLAFAGGLAGLWSLRPDWVTVAGLQDATAGARLRTWVQRRRG